uniref:Uncharacterized protein n=1 Tax=Sphenodon punctatus TaxID=8508 RepID=A0A8D0HLB2_SPHPU
MFHPPLPGVDNKHPRITGLCPFSSGELLVADEANHKLKRFSLQGEFKGTIPIPEYVAPCSVAAISGGKVAFTAGSRLYLLEKDGTQVWQKALRHSQASHAAAAVGDDRIAVSVSGHVEVYDAEGQLAEKVFPEGREERCLVFMVHRQGGFVASDWHRHSVVAFDSYGELLMECREEQLEQCQPGAVCADDTGAFYVVLRDLNKVVAFSADGEVLGPLLTAQNGIDRPRVATVTREGRLAVALSDGTVHVFRLRRKGK